MQRRDDCRILPQFTPEKPREHRTREIIGRRPQTAGGDDATGSLQRLTHGVGDFVLIIGDRGAAGNWHADLAERTREEDRIGIDGRAQEKFVTDGDDLDGLRHGS